MSRPSHFIRLTAALLTIAAMTGTSACGSDSSSQASQDTVTANTLTVATGEPAYEPWVIGNKPESGKGYESALVYAIAGKLGYSKNQVVWKRTTFDAAIAPGTKDWDLNIQQFSITDQRKKAVDFSPSYYNPTQSIVVRGDSKYASATSLSDFKGATIGAMVGTTSYDYAKQKLNANVQTFNDNTTLAQALDADQIDALVMDTPAAVNVATSSQVKNGKVVGQIPGSEDKQGMGIVLPKDSPLTTKVSKALNELKKDGTLKRLQSTWLKAYTTDIPTLK
ncbi:amino acid ABC transporter substrate-binding protein [Bifidobacterium adolescentis]|uniref:ABC transporter substrate-binding protein n=1 Tax=Bifidobacterium adolescentis TaxID=1680 RepID=UPI0005558320